jgi:two-component system, LytTR family, response regulator
MLKAIIIDDEEHCINTLQWNINQSYKEEIEIIAVTASAVEGLKLVNEHKPDILFLDIEMPHLNGIDLANMIQHNETSIVFTTAYDQYAIQAIKLNALDYLLKPVDEEELGKVIIKIKQQNSADYKNQIKNLQEAHKSKILNKIALNNMNGFTLVAFEDIIYIKGENTYSNFFLTKGSKILISKTLAAVQEMLDMNLFYRVHKSFIINLKHVSKYIKGDGGDVVMSDGTTIAVSRNKKDDFLTLF